MKLLKLKSRIGFGTASLHHVRTVKAQLNLLDLAYDLGINYFDTAPLYGHSNAERVLGRFVSKHRNNSSLIVATKIGLVPNPLVSRYPFMLYPYIFVRKVTTKMNLINPNYWQPTRDYSKKYLIQQVEQSLSNMTLDFIDVVYLHEPHLSDLQSIDNLLEAVSSLRKRGLLNLFGISAKIQEVKWLIANHPELADVLQVEVPIQMSDDDAKWIIENADSTFGHFRIQENQLHITPEERLKLVVKSAVKLNPNATILFSSTRSSNIKSFVSSIKLMDTRTKEV